MTWRGAAVGALSGAAVFAAVLFVWGRSGPHATRAPGRLGANDPLLRAAILAHGGAEHLARLAEMGSEWSGTLFGAFAFTATSAWAPGARYLSIRARGSAVSVNLTGDDCWFGTPFGVAVSCDPGQKEAADLSVRTAAARLLYPVLDQTVEPAEPVRVGDVTADALKVGDITLAFDRSSHLLVAMSYPALGFRKGQFTEVYDDFEEQLGVRIPRHVTTTWEAHAWSDATLTGLAPVPAIRRPPPPADLSPYDAQRPDLYVVWGEHRGSADRIPETIPRLVDFARQHGQAIDPSSGIYVTALHDPGEKKRLVFQVAVGLLPWKGAAVDDSRFHFATWPAARVAGVFRVGGFRDAVDAVSAAEQSLKERHLAKVTGARWHFLPLSNPETTPVEERLSLLEIEVRGTLTTTEQ